jgi:hypothetical protein
MKKLAVLVMLAIALVLTGCGKPPKADIDAAKSAYDAAVAAQAETFAPEAFTRAKAAIAALDAEVASQARKVFKSYDKAKSLAAAARKAADDARAAADTRKTELRNELPRTIASLRDGVRTTQSKLAGALAIRGISLDAAAARNDLASVAQLLTQAQGDLDAGRLADASTKANQARDLLARVNKTIDDARAAATVKKR